MDLDRKRGRGRDRSGSPLPPEERAASGNRGLNQSLAASVEETNRLEKEQRLAAQKAAAEQQQGREGGRQQRRSDRRQHSRSRSPSAGRSRSRSKERKQKRERSERAGAGTRCFDCGEQGHKRGDPACRRPRGDRRPGAGNRGGWAGRSSGGAGGRGFGADRYAGRYDSYGPPHHARFAPFGGSAPYGGAPRHPSAPQAAPGTADLLLQAVNQLASQGDSAVGQLARMAAQSEQNRGLAMTAQASSCECVAPAPLY